MEKKYNQINDSFIKNKDKGQYDIIEEEDVYGNTLNNNLFIKSTRKVTDKMGFYHNILEYSTIYAPINGEDRSLISITSGVFNIQAKEYLTELTRLDTNTINIRNLSIIAEVSESISNRNLVSLRENKFKKIYLHSKTIFNWENIIYDWRDLTDDLVLIMTEKQAYASNKVTPYEKPRDMMPPAGIGENFKNVYIIILKDNTFKEEESTGKSLDEILGGIDIFKELEDREPIELDFLIKDKEEDIIQDEVALLNDRTWVSIVESMIPFSSNIFDMSLKEDWLITKINPYVNFNSRNPVVVFVNEEEFRTYKDKSINVHPYLISFINSMKEYDKAYIKINSEKNEEDKMKELLEGL